MAYEAGTAFLQITPSFDNLEAALANMVEKIGRQVDHTLNKSIPASIRNATQNASKDAEKAGEKIGTDMSAGAAKSLDKDLPKAARDAGEKSALEFSGAFAKNLRARTGPAMSAIPKVDVKVDADLSEFDRKMMQVRASLSRLDKVYVKGKISDDTLLHYMDRNQAKLRDLQANAPDISGFSNAHAAEAELQQWRSMVENARLAGFQAAGAFGGAFDREVRQHVDSVLQDLPQVHLTPDSTELDHKLADIRKRFEDLRKVRIGVDLDSGAYEVKLRQLKDELGSTLGGRDVKFNLGKANAGLSGLLDEMFPRQDMERVAGRFGGVIEEEIHRGLNSVLKDLPEVHLGDGLTVADQRLDDIRKKLTGMSGFHLGTDVDIADYRRYVDGVKRELEDLASTADDDLKRSAESAAHRLGHLFDGVIQQPSTPGRRGGAFHDMVQGGLADVAAPLPQVTLGDSSSAVDHQIAGIRAALESLGGNYEIHLQTGQFEAALVKLKAELSALRDSTTDVDIKLNTEKSIGNIDKLLQAVYPKVEEAGQVAGDRWGGKFATQVGEHFKGAVAALPKVEIGADTTDAQIALKVFREHLQSLSNETIGVTVNEDIALAQIRDIKRELDQIARADPSVRVRVEAAAAAAELAGILKLAGDIDSSDPNIKVNVDKQGADAGAISLRDLTDAAGATSSRLGFLIALGATLGSVLVPAAGAAAVAIGGIAQAAGAAGAGIGVFALSMSGVIGGVQALNKYQNDLQKSDASLANSQERVAGALDSVKSAEQSLANTREQGADAAKRSAQSVVDAQRSVVDAQRQAEQSVKDLQKAYEDARKADEDRVLALRSGSLAQRQANLDLVDAKQKLDQIMANPRATEAEREQARITYEQRVLQLDELGVKQKRLQTEQDQATKAGVQGSTQVVAAQDKVRTSNENVAKAQERLASAIDAQQKQQRQGAFQLVQATQAVENAQRQLAKATTSAGVAGGAALSNLQTAMQNLGPAGEGFAKFIFGLKGQFLELRNVAQSSLLPGLQIAIEGLLGYMPQIKTFVGQVGATLGGIFIDIVQQLENPSWQRFFRFIGDTAAPTLKGMATFTMLVAQGLADVIVALSPFNNRMGAGLMDMAQGFAEWAATLSQSAGYYKFLAYVARTGPMVVELLGQLGELIRNIVVAAAPVGGTVLRYFTLFVDLLNKLPLEALTTLLHSVALFEGGLLAAGLALKVFTPLIDSVKLAVEAKNKVFQAGQGIMEEYRAKLEDAAKTATEVPQGMFSISASASEYEAKVEAAGNSTEGMSRKMAAAATVGGVLKNAGSGIMSAFGGPFGMALTAAGLAIGYAQMKAQEAASRIDSMKSSLIGLAEAYDKNTDATSQYLSNQIRSDENFKRMIQNSESVGINISGITQAVHGNSSALETVNGAYDSYLTRLTNANDLLHHTQDTNVESLAGYKEAADLQEAVYKKFGVSLGERIKQVQEEKKSVGQASDGYKELRVALGLAGESTDDLTPKVSALNAVLIGGKGSAEDFKAAIGEFGAIAGNVGGRAEALALVGDRIADSHLKASDKVGLFRDILQQLGSATEASGPTFDALAGVFDNIATSALSASDKTSLLKQTMDQMYGAAQQQIEAGDRMSQSQAELHLRLQDSSLGFDVKAASTSADTQAIIGNRTALREALTAVSDKYIADVAAAQQSDNVALALQNARDAHDRETKAITDQIPEAQRNSTAVQELVKAFGQIPPLKTTDIKVNGGEQALRELIKGFALQKGLSENWSKPQVNIYRQALLDEWLGPKIADGGMVPGQSPHKRADNIRAWLTAGEWVQPVDSVGYYGVDVMEAIRTRSVPREMLNPQVIQAFRKMVKPTVTAPGDGSAGIAFANGGLVAGGPTWPFPILEQVKMPVDPAELERRLNAGEYGWVGPISSDVASAQNWIRQQAGKPYIWASAGPQGFDCSGLISAVWNLLHGLQPYAHTFSTMNEAPYFPKSGGGMFTAAWTNPGEAGVGGGADGVGHTAANLAGLAFESRGGDGVVVGSRVTPLSRFAHIGHYDSGGKLPVGLGAYLNTTGTPENVLTDQQWNAVFDLAQQPTRAQGNTYQFAFRDTTLTESTLRAMQAADAVRARAGRAR